MVLLIRKGYVVVWQHVKNGLRDNWIETNIELSSSLAAIAPLRLASHEGARRCGVRLCRACARNRPGGEG